MISSKFTPHLSRLITPLHHPVKRRLSTNFTFLEINKPLGTIFNRTFLDGCRDLQKHCLTTEQEIALLANKSHSLWINISEFAQDTRINYQGENIAAMQTMTVMPNFAKLKECGLIDLTHVHIHPRKLQHMSIKEFHDELQSTFPFSTGVPLPEDFKQTVSNVSISQLIIPSPNDLEAYHHMSAVCKKEGIHSEFMIITEFGQTKIELNTTDVDQAINALGKATQYAYQDEIHHLFSHGPAIDSVLNKINEDGAITVTFSKF